MHAVQVSLDAAELKEILAELCPDLASNNVSRRQLCKAYREWLGPITADMPGTHIAIVSSSAIISQAA